MGIAGLPRAIPSSVLQQAQLHPTNLGACLWGAEPAPKANPVWGSSLQCPWGLQVSPALCISLWLCFVTL